MLTKFSESHPIVTGAIILTAAFALPCVVVISCNLIAMLIGYLPKAPDVSSLFGLVGAVAIFPISNKFYQVLCSIVKQRIFRLLPIAAVVGGYVMSGIILCSSFYIHNHSAVGVFFLSIIIAILYTIELVAMFYSWSVYKRVLAGLPITTVENAEPADTAQEE